MTTRIDTTERQISMALTLIQVVCWIAALIIAITNWAEISTWFLEPFR